MVLLQASSGCVQGNVADAALHTWCGVGYLSYDLFVAHKIKSLDAQHDPH